MVWYFHCTGCRKPVDEFEQEYRLAEMDQRKLCRKCREAKDEQSEHDLCDVRKHPRG